jgi:hypothetical protein
VFQRDHSAARGRADRERAAVARRGPKLEASSDGMLCRHCDAVVLRETWRGAATPVSLRGPERIRDLLCTHCGTILAAEDIAQRLLEKQSQLALFGLAGPGPVLLEPGHEED